MKKVKLVLTMVLVTGMVAMFLESCKKDDAAPAPLKLVSLMTDGGVALDGATTATNIPLNASVVATFDKKIDAATATSANIALLANGVEVPSTITVADAVVTLKPNADMATGTNYTLSVAPTLKASDGAPTTSAELTFKTFGRASVVPPKAGNQVAFWKFDGNTNAAVGNFNSNAAIDLTFGADRFGFAGLSGSFNGTSTIVEVPNAGSLATTASFTLSFWVKTNSANKTSGHFVIGLGGSKGFQFEIDGAYANCKLAAQYDLGANGTGSEDLWVDATGNLGWQGWDFSKDYTSTGGFVNVIKDKWTHIVCTYDAPSKRGTAYVNGEKAKSQDFNLWPGGDPKQGAVGLKYAGIAPAYQPTLAFGFITDRASTAFDLETWGDYTSPTSNHFKGLLDDVRIFTASYTQADVTTLYNAEKP